MLRHLSLVIFSFRLRVVQRSPATETPGKLPAVPAFLG
jgi:hypothetical protein